MMFLKRMNDVVKELASVIKDTSFNGKVFLVGGAVRDIIMGNPTDDFDFVVVDHGIDGGIKLARYLNSHKLAHGLTVFPRFGTASVLFGKDNIEFEFVAPRVESYKKGSRKPIVTPGHIYDDIFRRDFTINSMLINISTGELIDRVNGRDHIDTELITTTGNARYVFKEDPLRIMRGVRFAARFGFKIEINTYDAMMEGVDNFKFVSNERIRDEFMKILMDDSFKVGLTLLKQFGILSYMIPAFAKVDEIKNPGRFHTKNLFDHLLEVIGKTKKTPGHRLAALLHDIGKVHTMKVDGDGVSFHGHSTVGARIANGFMTNFKYPNDFKYKVVTAVEMHMDFWDNVTIKRLRREHAKLGLDTLLFVLDLIRADSKNIFRVQQVDEMIELVKTDDLINNPPPKPIVNGNELMERYNLKPSKLVGELISDIQDMMFEDPNITRDEVFLKLDKKMDERV